MKYEQIFLNVISIIQLTISLILGSIYIGYILGYAIAAMFISYLISAIILAISYALRAKIMKKLLEAKDKRVNLLKNIVNNIKYIKMRAWELLYHYKLFFLREEEIKRLFHLAYLAGFAVFVTWFTRSLALVSVLFFKTYFDNENFGYEEISAFLRIFDLIRMILLLLPWNVNYFVDLGVSNRRIGLFYKAEEIDFSWVQVEGSKGSEEDFALEMENGYFEWNKKNEKKEKDKKEKRNRIKGLKEGFGKISRSKIDFFKIFFKEKFF